MDINVKGTIVPNDDKWIYDYLKYEAVCPKDVTNIISEANGQPLDIYINSPGGDIGAGSEIYAALESYRGEVNIHVVGYACSSASVIACAGHSDMVRTGLFMYHNVSGGVRGDYHVMDKSSRILRTANEAIAAAYVAKTGKHMDELLKEMDAETWLTAEEAVNMGFIDSIAENKNLKLAASASGMLPQKVLDQIRNTVKNPQSKSAQADIIMPELETLKAKLNYLKLGGKTK